VSLCAPEHITTQKDAINIAMIFFINFIGLLPSLILDKVPVLECLLAGNRIIVHSVIPIVGAEENLLN
jgi:hypothetical protein